MKKSLSPPVSFTGREIRARLSDSSWVYEPPVHYWGTWLIRNTPPVGPYGSPMPGDLWRSYGGGSLMSEEPL